MVPPLTKGKTLKEKNVLFKNLALGKQTRGKSEKTCIQVEKFDLAISKKRQPNRNN